MINRIIEWLKLKSNRTLVSSIAVFTIVALSLISVQVYDNFGNNAIILINIFQLISTVMLVLAISMCIYSIKIDIKERITTIKELKSNKNKNKDE